ncbi:MAG: VWA domain-containing protein, partial [Lachnospiraceae bacterium]|nr:VWA domain-containing protein [Lachnospiraceae bacterium]
MGDRTERKLDISLFFACLAGGFTGFAMEEFLHRMIPSVPAIVDVALRTALFFLVVFLFALICEMITGHLNGGSWNGRQTGRSILFTILFPILIGLIAMLFQFIYQLDFSGKRPSTIQDYIILVDNSLSVTWTDPDNERYDAVVDFVSTLNGSNQVMIKVFSDDMHYGPQNNFPLTAVTEDTPERIRTFFNGFVIETSGTNLTRPLL